jgi:NADPH:quinone reductase-like Zn-dependent oxidoreductase
VIEKGQAEVQRVAIPQLRPDYILVKVDAVALCPADWKSLDFLSTPGRESWCFKTSHGRG